MEDSAESTFMQNVVVPLEFQVNSFGVDSTGGFAVLAARKGLTVLDLESPREAVKTILHSSKWDVTDVAWNPHLSRASYIASTSNQKALIWDVNDERNPTTVLHNHTRAISDLCWSHFEDYMLATCSIDTFIHLWDVRDPRKVSTSLCAKAGASQVKWNRHNPHLLATSHEGDVRVWDIRKGSAPAIYITGHMSKIYGMDWSRTHEHELVTAGQDRLVKFWNITQPRVCQETLTASAPVWRVRYTPFGEGVLTVIVPQLRHNESSRHHVHLWSRRNLKTPVHAYVGHTDIVREFDWRVRGSDDLSQFQLATWSKDQTLRLWRIDPLHQQACGHTPRGPMLADVAVEPDVPSGAVAHVDAAATKPVVPPSVLYGGDLAQEFANINFNMPNVVIEKFNATHRNCVVTAKGTSGHMVRVLISFPALYPNNASPSFEFLANTTVPTSVRARMTEVLNQKAQGYVAQSRPCLEPCLRELVNQLASFAHGESKAAQASSPARDETVPFPRLSGAVFCANGALVSFSARLRRPGGRVMPRSYDRLRAFAAEVGTGSALVSRRNTGSLFTRNPSGSLRTAIALDRAAGMGGFGSFGGLNNAMQSALSGLEADPAGASALLGGGASPGDDPDADLFDDGIGMSAYYGKRALPGGRFARPGSPTSSGASTPQPHRAGFGKGAEERRPASPSVVAIYDASVVMPISRALGELYTLSGATPADVCRANAAAARVVRREDLVQMWLAASLVLDPCVVGPQSLLFVRLHQLAAAGTHRGKSSTRDSRGPCPSLEALLSPWSSHPFARNMFESYLRHYEQQRDVQTLAMLACVFALPDARALSAVAAINGAASNVPGSAVTGRRHKPNPYAKRDASGGPVHAHHQSISMSSPIHGPVSQSVSTISLPAYSPSQPVPMASSQQQMVAPTSSSSLVGSIASAIAGDRYGPSDMDFFGVYGAKDSLQQRNDPHQQPQTQQQQQKGNAVVELERRAEDWMMLDPRRASVFDAYRRAYADILYCWGELESRAEVLKFVTDPPNPHIGIGFEPLCRWCSVRTLRGPRCDDCKQLGFGFACAVCHVGIRGMSTFCVVCGHGGHAEHMEAWFETHALCPTGCGCRCQDAVSETMG